MSDQNSLGQQESFTSKLDIMMVTTKRFRKMVDINACIPDVVVCAVGKPGIGKTAIPKQAAADRGAPHLKLSLPEMSNEDWWIPTMSTDSRHYYDKRIPHTFQPLLDFCEKNKGKIKPGKGPIISLEELNRAKDSVLNACFIFLSTRMIGDIKLPDEIQIVATMNPAGMGRVVSVFEQDDAFRRRLLWVGVTASFGDFIQYARAAQFHKHVIAHLEAQPTWFYSDIAAAAGKQYPNPASWEIVSKQCKVFEEQDISLTSPEAKASYAGIIGGHATQAFVDFVEHGAVEVTGAEVLKGYKEDSTVRGRVMHHVKQGNQVAISKLLKEVVLTITDGEDRPPKSFVAQLGLFMLDITGVTGDNLHMFIKQLSDACEGIDGGSAYRSLVTRCLNDDANFATAIKLLAERNEESDKVANG